MFCKFKTLAAKERKERKGNGWSRQTQNLHGSFFAFLAFFCGDPSCAIPEPDDTTAIPP